MYRPIRADRAIQARLKRPIGLGTNAVEWGHSRAYGVVVSVKPALAEDSVEFGRGIGRISYEPERGVVGMRTTKRPSRSG